MSFGSDDCALASPRPECRRACRQHPTRCPRVEPCSELFTQAFKTFQEQTSRKLSFTDSTIAYVAQQRAEGLVLTFDDEFRRVDGIQIPR